MSDDTIPFCDTLSVRDDGIVRVLVLRREPDIGAPASWSSIELWHQRIDTKKSPMRRLMVYSDTAQGRQAAEMLADHLAGMS